MISHILHISEAQFYQGGTEFKCLSDGKTIPMEHVNDDFCDCEDGSDEPGQLLLYRAGFD